MRWSLPQLEAFYWVARLGGFRAAARHLNLTQPTVSQRVRELERALEAELFDRSDYRPRLTRSGVAILSQAENVLALAEDIGRPEARPEPLRGLLRLGAADSFAITCLPQLLGMIERRHPALRVEVTVAYSRSLSQLLAARELDLAFVSHPETRHGIGALALGNIELAWVTSPRRAPLGEPVRPLDLAGAQIVTNPPPSHLHSTIEAWFAAGRQPLPRISTCNALTVIARLVASGFGMSILPRCLLTREFGRGALRALEAEPAIPPHVMYVAYADEVAGPSLDAVITAARGIVERARILAPLAPADS